MIVAAEALPGLFEETQGEKGGKQTPALFYYFAEKRGYRSPFILSGTTVTRVRRE